MASIEWQSDVSTRGVRERGCVLHTALRDVPAILWSAADRDDAQPLVLVGHGGSGHKRQGYGLSLARRLVRHHGIAAVAIDGPVHGDRRPADLPEDAVEATRRRYARPEVADAMVADWRETLEAVAALPEIDAARVGYLGLSMGTLFGVPLLAVETRVRAAVLGLMGIRPDGGRIARRLAADAPKVTCPLLFLQQRQDELFASDTSGALFDALGAKDKRLLGHAGLHGEVPPAALVGTLRFLARHLGAPLSRQN
jgi:dienelactone hydrolase